MIYLVFNFLFLCFLINCVNCFFDKGCDTTGLFNEVLIEQNPSAKTPPKTDAGSAQPFKYPFAFSPKRKYDGGWTKSVTVNDLSIATKVAGALTRLERGGVRELHWHIGAELAYVICGKARIHVVDEKGRAFVGDVEKGDLFYIPEGYGHSVQGIGKDGVLLLATYNDPTITTFNLHDWLLHTPREVLSKNFKTQESTFDNLPKDNIYIFSGELPKSLKEDRRYVSKETDRIPESLIYYSEKVAPNVTNACGSVRIVDKSNFPITTLSAAIIKLKPGALRELHWNLYSDVWQYYIKGNARVTVFSGNGVARTTDFQEGDVGYVQQSRGYYVENSCEKDLIYIEIFATPYYGDISLAQWLAHNPPRLVDGHIHTGERFIENINKTKQVIVC